MDPGYFELLHDGRWQILRAEVLQRDEWRCTVCRADARDGVFLHVHHLEYTAEFPWAEPAHHLTTLCETCHAAKHGRLSWSVEDIERLRSKLGRFTKIAVDHYRRANEAADQLIEIHQKARKP